MKTTTEKDSKTAHNNEEGRMAESFVNTIYRRHERTTRLPDAESSDNSNLSFRMAEVFDDPQPAILGRS